MGNRLERQAWEFRPDPALSKAARLALLFIAYKALDKPKGDDPAAHWWGGWRVVAQRALYYDDPDTEPARKAVARVRQELTRAGAIKAVDQGYGHRTVYAVLPDWYDPDL